MLGNDDKIDIFQFFQNVPDAAGFEVLFNSKRDRPYHLTCSVQLFESLFASRVELPTGQVDNNTDEILNVPNFALTYKTNILDQVGQEVSRIVWWKYIFLPVLQYS